MWVIIFLIRLYIICVGPSVRYADRPVLHADGPNGLFRVCAVRGGSGASLGNSFLKTGRLALRCGRSGHAQIDEFTADLRKRLWLPRARVYQHPVKGL
jgi:hypothetical protein